MYIGYFVFDVSMGNLRNLVYFSLLPFLSRTEPADSLPASSRTEEAKETQDCGVAVGGLHARPLLVRNY